MTNLSRQRSSGIELNKRPRGSEQGGTETDNPPLKFRMGGGGWCATATNQYTRIPGIWDIGDWSHRYGYIYIYISLAGRGDYQWNHMLLSFHQLHCLKVCIVNETSFLFLNLFSPQYKHLFCLYLNPLMNIVCVKLRFLILGYKLSMTFF